MTDLAGRTEQAHRLANEMWSGAGDSAARSREQIERYPELAGAALGLSLCLVVLVVLVFRAVRRSARRHQAAQLRDDLVDAVRMGEIDAGGVNDFRVFAMIDFCDRVAKGGRRPPSGRHASTRPVLDSALAGSLISAVGPGSLLPPGGPFWPYAAPEPGEVEISDVWVRAVSFQRQVMGRRRSRDAEMVEPVPTPGSAPAPRRLVSVPTGELPFVGGVASASSPESADSGEAERASEAAPDPELDDTRPSPVVRLARQHVDLPDDSPETVPAPPAELSLESDRPDDGGAVPAHAVSDFEDPWAPAPLGDAIFDAATPIADSILALGDPGANDDRITSVDAAPDADQQAVGELSTDDAVVTSGPATATSEVRVETVFESSDVKPGSEVVPAAEGDAAVSEIIVPEPGDDSLSAPRHRSHAARPFDPLFDPLSGPLFEPGDAPSEELEPVFLAAAAAQKAADQAAQERADQERVMRERVAHRWAALRQVAKERAAEPVEEPVVDEAGALSEVAPLEPARGAALSEAVVGERPATEWVEPVRSIDLRSLDLRPREAPQQIDLTRIERLQGQPVEVSAGGPASLHPPAPSAFESSPERAAQRSVRYHVGETHVAGESDAAGSRAEWESPPAPDFLRESSAGGNDPAPPTNPIPVPTAPSAQEEFGPDEPDQDQPGLRPRWMSPGVAPAEPVGGVVEVVGGRGQSRKEGPVGPSPRSGFWGRRAPRRSRSNLVEVTGHGKPPGALVPFDQVPLQGGAPEAETQDVRDAPMVGDEAVR